MCARPVKRNDSDFGILLIEQQPVGIDVALPVTIIVAREQVVVVLERQRLVFAIASE